jgi:hypothetical protein
MSHVTPNAGLNIPGGTFERHLAVDRALEVCKEVPGTFV